MKQSKKVWYAPNKLEAYGEEEIKAVEQCLRDGWLAGFGPRSIEFEEKIAKEFGKKFGVFVNSGSSACLLALAALDLKKGSKVITPALTFSTTLAPIIQLGYIPIFIDSNLKSYVPNVQDIINAVTDDVKAIIVPNLIGNKPDWKLLKQELKRIGREDIYIIEDSADTVTKTLDSDVSTTSFYASHVITAGGMGGMVMFNDEKYVKRALQYRDWGRIGDNNENIDDIFKEKIDIHGGGSGLMFPHHENEIAQSKVLNNHSIATYWMHNGLLNIGGSKMSKSDGDIVLVKDLTIDPNSFRLFTLSTHYRSPIQFTDEVLESYEKEWEKVSRVYKSLFLKLDLEDGFYVNAKIDPDLLEIYKEFLTAMDNDFNTANAITALQNLVKKANQMLRSKTENEVLLSALKIFDDFFGVLGLKPGVTKLSKEAKDIYSKWNFARNAKDFNKADEYRAVLQEMGII